jgi:carbon storage regulator
MRYGTLIYNGLLREQREIGRCTVLVLTRRTEESVVIGDNIIVTVLGVEGEKVKLGIDAPREVTILRRELLDAIQQQNRLAEKLASMPEPPAMKGLRELLTEEPGETDPAPTAD